MATVNGKLENVISGEIEAGSVEVALCGYGSYLPRGGDGALYARPTSLPQQIPVAADGTFSFTVFGNDQIEPAGTYYTITIKDSNGDIVQCAAYLFLGGSNYDLDTTDPFDPTQPPPPLPPRVINQLLIVPPSATPDFPGDQYTAWGIQLNQDVTSSTLSNIVQGNLYTFIITQDATGGWKFTWPSLVLDPVPVNPTPGGATIQTFVAIANGGPLLPIAAGTWY